MKSGVQPGNLALVAHRGYARHYPENTWLAIEAAVAAGADAVEFDVQLTGDGVPVLLHDESLLRTAGRDVSVFALTAAEVEAIPVGERARFGETYASVTTSRLDAVLAALAQHPAITLFVELKRQSLTEFGSARVLDAVLPLLSEQAVVISFDIAALRAVRERSSVRIGWVLPEWSESARVEASELAPAFLFCNEQRLPPAPEPLWSGCWQWVVYEVVDRARALALQARGVDMIETMAIGELRAALDGAEAL